MKHLDLLEHFSAADGGIAMQLRGAQRRLGSHDGVDIVRDDFADEAASALFLRVQRTATAGSVRLRLAGNHLLKRCAIGGWMFEPTTPGEAVFWVPRLPVCRTLDGVGRIRAESPATLANMEIGGGEVAATFELAPDQVLDCVVWRLESEASGTDGSRAADELMTASALESQAFFAYASHTATRCAADFYTHIVHGQVYGACWAWPKKLKICDELDALALHMVASALGHSTGKRVYRLLRRQIVLAVLCRQDADGGFRHGEWTDEYESHNRLINGAMQLLATEFAAAPEPALEGALRRIARYLAEQVDHTDAGAWFLHDSLERSEEGMRHYPLAWERGRWLGKSPTNLLILNTHLDCMLALARERAACGDDTHDGLLRSAEACLRTVMSARPADWLFRPLLAVIALSLLPKAEQEQLPFARRALKRLGWKYLIPRWHLIRRRFPRLLMPAGYIERSLGQADFVHRYHGVHLMDFERLLACGAVDPKDPRWTSISDGLVDFGVNSRVTRLWKETAASRDSLAFWAEGLYRRCLRTRAQRDRELLATAVLDLHDAGLGLPPSLLGANGEIVPAQAAAPTPSAADARLRVINLGARKTPCLLVVNTATTDLPLAFEPPLAAAHPGWMDATRSVPARGWILLQPGPSDTEPGPASSSHAFLPARPR